MSESLGRPLVAKLIRCPVLIGTHLRAATQRKDNAYIRAIENAVADLPAAPLPPRLSEFDEAEAWLGFYQKRQEGGGGVNDR